MKTSELIAYLFGGTGIVGSVIMYLLAWARFKKRDTVNVDKIKADSNKTYAEAQEIRAKSDVLITDGAFRIVERLSNDLDEAREEIDKLIIIASDLKTLHEKHRVESFAANEELITKLKEANIIIETKRRDCVDIKYRVIQLKELLILKQSGVGLSVEQSEEFLRKLNEIIAFKE